MYNLENEDDFEAFITEVANTILDERNLIKEFKNQLQQKGIHGERLETAVADFVKFLKKQNKKSGENAPCSEPAASQNNVGDKENDNG